LSLYIVSIDVLIYSAAQLQECLINLLTYLLRSRLRTWSAGQHGTNRRYWGSQQCAKLWRRYKTHHWQMTADYHVMLIYDRERAQ